MLEESRLQLDLSALPSDVTEMYFVISAEESYDCRDLGDVQFCNGKMRGLRNSVLMPRVSQKRNTVDTISFFS